MSGGHFQGAAGERSGQRGKIDHYKVSRVIQSDDYYPFGLTLAGTEYQRIGVKENRYLYNGKELQTDLDLNWYDYGARMYDPVLGRFFMPDFFADKYYDLSPFHYAANNPALYIDVNGDSINFTSILHNGGVQAVVNILSDLSEQTGLSSIGINSNGNLTYGTDDNGNTQVTTDDEGNQLGSATARNLITKAASDDKTRINVQMRENAGSATTGNDIGIDPKQIQGFINGTSGKLNSKTMGFGMTFMHELNHTDFAGGLSDTEVEGATGPAVDKMNVIRKELDKNPMNRYLGRGTIYGVRSSYLAIPTGPVQGMQGYQHVYIPFNGNRNQINTIGKERKK